MRNYELTMLISPLVSPEEAANVLEKIVTAIQNQGGIVSKQETQGKRRLPSPIQKQREGLLGVVTFSLQSDTIEEIKAIATGEANILRSMIMLRPMKVRRVPTIAPKSTPPRQTEKERVEIGDIDKKLEEIFSE